MLRRLEEVHGIAAGRLRATGFGHTKPLVDPARAGSQNINKRVDIVVLSQAPAETRALMDDAYDEVRRQAGLDASGTSPTTPTTPTTPTSPSDPHASASGRHVTTREDLP
ncbi:hypothetical protein G5V59_12650 [Nocardioides sp. W3-2-3]|uniref:hypothetical protein n=1 Tax=Nocardioides convexus TaxID=2712224 RepID=UPI0024187F36|nr:hypothetical protein [Nocardioides convexus]NHA00582.1 hypothetical protein [Nocardioides convexus]